MARALLEGREARAVLTRHIFVPGPDGGESRLFDLRADPAETRNVAAEAPEVLAELRAPLLAILASDERAPSERTLTPEELDRLRELGYLE